MHGAFDFQHCLHERVQIGSSLHNSLCFLSLRLQVTDTTDDVEVLSCGLAASDALYPPAMNAGDDAPAAAGSGGAASVQVDADGSAAASFSAAGSGTRSSFNDKLTALGNALGLTLTTEFDATSSQAIQKLPLKPPAAATAEEASATASEEGAPPTTTTTTITPANAASVALEEMASELAQELKKTAMLGEMMKAAVVEARHGGNGGGVLGRR